MARLLDLPHHNVLHLRFGRAVLRPDSDFSSHGGTGQSAGLRSPCRYHYIDKVTPLDIIDIDLYHQWLTCEKSSRTRGSGPAVPLR